MDENVALIRQMVPRSELLTQLAEEANELAIAALKLNEIYSITNILGVGKPLNKDKLISDFTEEIADVMLCIDTTGDYNGGTTISMPTFPKDTIIQSLVETSCLLSKGALKLRRAITPEVNPTPISVEEAEDNFIGLVEDLQTYLYSITEFWDGDKVIQIYQSKAKRWIERLNNRR